MRGFFARLFGRDTDKHPEIHEAEEKHKRATAELKSAQIRQMEDAEYVRQTIDNVLSRIEGRK